MKIFAKVQYLGVNYHGWQKQNNANSVQEEIEKVLSKILNNPITIYGSGRTDAGVHALGQTFHFEVNKEVDVNQLMYASNMLLPRDIKLLSMEVVDEEFHARYSAKGKHYQYQIALVSKDPFLEGRVAFIPQEFDLDLFKEAINKFVGKHDFKCFTSKEEDEDNFMREITSIEVNKEDNLLKIDLYGNGFMRYMIRFIVGTSLAVAMHKEDISFIDNHLDNNEREIVSYKIESDGLYLIDVIY